MTKRGRGPKPRKGKGRIDNLESLISYSGLAAGNISRKI